MTIKIMKQTTQTKQYWMKKRLSLVRIIFVMSLSFTTTNLFAETKYEDTSNKKLVHLTVTPERCVALRESQVCYQNIVLKWQTDNKGDFCLFVEGSNNFLRCWSNLDQGRFEMDFQSKKSRRFVLRTKNDSAKIADAEVIVAWVYGNKKRRRASWRLF
jgi:hypothetical protein